MKKVIWKDGTNWKRKRFITKKKAEIFLNELDSTCCWIFSGKAELEVFKRGEYYDKKTKKLERY